jgi:hypothetical protein
MNFPCPHCGSDESFHNRSVDDFKPIVPVELQGDFTEPPPPVTSSVPSSTFQKPSQAPKSSRSQISSSQGFSGQEVDYRFESTPSSIEPIRTTDFTTGSQLENIEKTIRNIENEIQTFSADLENIQKSQKVIESILTNINKKLLKL